MSVLLLKASLREGGGSQRLTEGVLGKVKLCRKNQMGEHSPWRCGDIPLDEGDVGKEARRLAVLIRWLNSDGVKIRPEAKSLFYPLLL